MGNRLGGTLSFKRNGVLLNAKGDFTYNLGSAKRETLMGSNSKPQGFAEKGQAPFLEGALTLTADFDVKDFLNADGDTWTLDLANGSVFVLRDGWYTGEGTMTTAEGELGVRIEGKDAEIIK